MATSPEENQDSAEQSNEPVKKKASRKRVSKKTAPAVESGDVTSPEAVPAPKKKVSRKRVTKKVEDAPAVDSSEEKREQASTPTAPDPARESVGNEAAASDEKPQSTVRRESGIQDRDRDEDGDKKPRRRRRRRRGGDSRDGDDQSDTQEEERDDRPASQRVKVRQPQSQRQQDRRPSNYKEDPKRLSKYAWQLYKNEIREEGGTLIEDRDARKIAERAFRMAEVFLIEEAKNA